MKNVLSKKIMDVCRVNQDGQRKVYVRTQRNKDISLRKEGASLRNTSASPKTGTNVDLRSQWLICNGTN